MRYSKHSMSGYQSLRRVVRRSIMVLAALPVLQVGACTQVDLQSAITVGLANYAITQFTIAADTIFRNVLGV
jgi:hypothetical protein